MKAKWKDTETAIRFGLAWMVAAVGLNIVEAHGQQLAVDFNRDIRPVLAESCFACHGPDEQQRQADLRLDLRSSAIESGALTPGSPDDSEMLRRIESQDESEQMPPPEHDPRLTVEQKQNFGGGSKRVRPTQNIGPSCCQSVPFCRRSASRSGRGMRSTCM